METLAEIYESGASAIHDLQSQLAEANAEITTLRESLAWRDIESAPKDGTNILLALFAHQSMQWACKGSFVRRRRSQFEYWYGSDGTRLRPPTHWRPLGVPDKCQRGSSGEGGRDG